MATPVSDGYFPRGESVLRRVHRTRIVGVLYGQRALLMQAADPLAFAGLMNSTSGLDAPFARLAHTAKTMEAIFFGSRQQADRELERVRRLHSRVHGALDRPAGLHPAGSPYRADAPELLLWVLACLADSAQAAYERFVRRLDGDERERFWSDYLLLGELFGLPAEAAPADYAAYRSYIDRRLRGPELHVTPAAREIGRRVAFELPLPAHRRPALLIVNFLVQGLLPPRVRDLYGIAWGPEREAAFDGVAANLRIGAWLSPRGLRRGPSAGDYELVARSERRRLGRAA